MTIRALTLRLLPAVLTVAAGLAIAVAVGAYRDQRSQRAGLQAILESAGLDERSPRLSSLVRSDPDVYAAHERVALALVADLLDPNTRSGAASPADLERQLEEQIDRLTVVEELASTVLEVRPTSWRSLTASGAAIYLRRSLRRNEDLLRAYQDWEAPLLRARQLAPGRAEPARFLTMAYLELWPVLSAEKRELTRTMITPALSDRTAYRATIEAWLQVAGDDLETVERLPQVAWLLDDVTERLVRRGRLDLALESHRRWSAALTIEAESALDSARAASSRGFHSRASKVATAALVMLPAQSQWLPLAEQLLAAVPSGLLKNQARFTHQWFDFELAQCLRSECRLPPVFSERILPMSARAPQDQLVAALSQGDWRAMERIELELETDERCQGPLESYWLAKASRALRENDVETARSALTECPGVSDALQLKQAQVLRAARRRDAGAGEAQSTMVATLGNQISNGHEFALPAGDYELSVAFTVGRPSLVDILVDRTLVASLPLTPESDTRTIRITSSGSAQFLEASLVAGSARAPRIVDFRPLRDPGTP